jgi:hypothetical protein
MSRYYTHLCTQDQAKHAYLLEKRPKREPTPEQLYTAGLITLDQFALKKHPGNTTVYPDEFAISTMFLQ